MYPILFNIGPIYISSFALFLALSLGVGSFIVWRLTQVYDLEREKILDLILLSFGFGLLGSRLFYIIFNLSEFNSIEKFLLINKYPGFYLWGGVLTGIGTLFVFSRRFKFDFWLICDLAIVGLFVGLLVSSFGCIFSGCMYGQESNLPVAISLVGVFGERFPIQVLFTFLYFIFFLILWKKSLRFHFQGAVLSLGLIYLGLINLILGFFRGDQKSFFLGFSINTYISALAILVGFRLYYYLGKRSFKKDLLSLKAFFTNKESRSRSLLKFKKSWYNTEVKFKDFFGKSLKKIGRKFNVKINPREF